MTDVELINKIVKSFDDERCTDNSCELCQLKPIIDASNLIEVVLKNCVYDMVHDKTHFQEMCAELIHISFTAGKRYAEGYVSQIKQ